MNVTSPRHVVMLSGGKDSTALALYLRDRHPERSFEYVFCDTHKVLQWPFSHAHALCPDKLARLLDWPYQDVDAEPGLGERGNILPSSN